MKTRPFSGPVKPPIQPMLAKVSESIPRGEGWLYEPKWDGFRAIVFREDEKIHIASRNQRPLERYFPELIEPLSKALPKRCVVDGEIVIAGSKGLDFDALQLRIHPAASRVNMLAKEIPARYVAFDLLALDSDLREKPLSDRFAKLKKAVKKNPSIMLTPQTTDPDEAQEWFERFEGAGLDGVVAKKASQRYVSGERVMMKIKHLRTADCVIGGYRLSGSGDEIGSLLLGLFDDQGHLHYVGHTSSFKAEERRKILEQLRPLEGDAGFGRGRTPGGPSRWSAGKETTWVSVKPKLVCEVSFDHLQGDRFRHATRFLRWRPDKKPKECRFDQLLPPKPFRLEDITG